MAALPVRRGTSTLTRLPRVPGRVELVQEPGPRAEDQDDRQQHDPQRDEGAPASTAAVTGPGGVRRRRVALVDGLAPELVALLDRRAR